LQGPHLWRVRHRVGNMCTERFIPGCISVEDRDTAILEHGVKLGLAGELLASSHVAGHWVVLLVEHLDSSFFASHGGVSGWVLRGESGEYGWC